MEQLLQNQLLNQFSNGAVITWDDLLQKMSSAHGRSRDEVFAAMNELIDEGRIAMPKKVKVIACLVRLQCYSREKRTEKK